MTTQKFGHASFLTTLTLPVACLQSNFAPVDEIGGSIEILQIEGEMPEDFPEGVYIRNGDRVYLFWLLWCLSKCGRRTANKKLTVS